MFFLVRGGVYNTDLVNMCWPISAMVFIFILCVIVVIHTHTKLKQNGVKMMLGGS